MKNDLLNDWKYDCLVFQNRCVGRLAVTSDQRIAFQYDEDWLKDGFSISPFYLPLTKEVYILSADFLEALQYRLISMSDERYRVCALNCGITCYEDTEYTFENLAYWFKQAEEIPNKKKKKTHVSSFEFDPDHSIQISDDLPAAVFLYPMLSSDVVQCDYNDIMKLTKIITNNDKKDVERSLDEVKKYNCKKEKFEYICTNRGCAKRILS